MREGTGNNKSPHPALQQSKRQEETGEREQTTAIQWLIGGASTLLVLLLLGFILYEAMKGTDLPPIISVRSEKIVLGNQGFVVQFAAKNSGGLTAKSVNIEGRLTEDGKEIEKSNATLSFVPSHAERHGGLFFSHDPRQYQLEIKPKGYDRP